MLEYVPIRTDFSCALGDFVVIRYSAGGLRGLSSGDSVVEALSASMLHDQFRKPSESEKRSWRLSLPALANVLADAGLERVEVLLEYQLPFTSRRVDAIVAGIHPKTGVNSYVVVELKQWSSAELFEGDPHLVRIDGYGHRPVAHPLAQVNGYRDYLIDFLPGLGDCSVSGVAYLHNATDLGVSDLRLAEPDYPTRLFTGGRRGEFIEYLRSVLDDSQSGSHAADDLLSARQGPSKQLMAVAAEEIQKRERFILLDEQQVAYNMVLYAVEAAKRGDTKSVIVITGGPGTGKSVIALSLLGELSRRGVETIHATGSRSFTQTLRKVAGKGSTRTQSLFKYFNSFMTAEKNGLEVLLLDEAHRIRETSENRYTKAQFRQGRPQIDELISAARVPVFLLDQHQVVRPGELGTLEDIRAFSATLGLQVHHISLDDQFRCGGSEIFMSWVLALLGLDGGEPRQWVGDDNFSLSLAESPRELEAVLESKMRQGLSARMTAGYCWPWSDYTDELGLIDDVCIGDWSRPWNSKLDRAINGIPPSALWATDPAGFGQVGCIYTAQGFEYDWNGVVIGPDLVWRDGGWLVRRSESRDPAYKSVKNVSDDELDELVRNVYKVLLTRGMQGTVVYSTDPQTRDFLRTLIP